MNKNVVGATLVSICLLSAGIPAHADGVSLVINADSSMDSMTKKEAKKLWLGKIKSVGGQVLIPSDNEESAPHKIFYKSAVKKKPSQLKAYWAKIVFKGKATLPNVVSNDSEVIEIVSAKKNTLGYVDSKSVNDSVKVLLTIKQ